MSARYSTVPRDDLPGIGPQRMLGRPVGRDVVPAPNAIGRVGCRDRLTGLCIGLADSNGLLEGLVLQNVIVIEIVPAGGIGIVFAGSALRFRRCCRGIRIGVASDEYLEHIRLPTFIWVQLNYSVKTVREPIVDACGAVCCGVAQLTPTAVNHSGRVKGRRPAGAVGPQNHVKVLHGDPCKVGFLRSPLLYAGIAVRQRIIGIQISLLKPFIRQRRIEVMVHKVEIPPTGGRCAAGGAIPHRVIGGGIDGIAAGRPPCCSGTPQSKRPLQAAYSSHRRCRPSRSQRYGFR